MSQRSTTHSPPRIAVVGSINMDLVINCDRLPKPGETIAADSSREVSGGKGANQAVAAKLAGGDVSMIGRVGDDAFATRLLEGISDQQVEALPQNWWVNFVSFSKIADGLLCR